MRSVIFWNTAAILFFVAHIILPIPVSAQAIQGLRYCSFQCKHLDGSVYTPNILPVNNTCTDTAECVTKCNSVCPNRSQHAPGEQQFQEGDVCAPSPPATNPPTCTAPVGGTLTQTGTGVNTGGYGLYDPLENRSLPIVIKGILRFAIGITGALFLLYFVFGGFTWMTARGDPTKVKNAQTTLRNAVLGMVVVGASYFLVNLVITLSERIN